MICVCQLGIVWVRGTSGNLPQNHIELPPNMCSDTIIVCRGLTALLATRLYAAEPWGLLDGHAGWSGDAAYPCDDSKLCEPIATPRVQEDVRTSSTLAGTPAGSTTNGARSRRCIFGAVDQAVGRYST
jgi:hypothetical protein